MDRSGVGVGILIIRDGKILLGKRKGGTGAGTWCLPGGKLEMNESLEECAKREVKEETGMEVDGLELVSISNDIAYDKHWVTIGMKPEIIKGEPVVNEPDQAEEWKWFDPDGLPEPLFEASKNLIDNYLSKRIYKR